MNFGVSEREAQYCLYFSILNYFSTINIRLFSKDHLIGKIPIAARPIPGWDTFGPPSFGYIVSTIHLWGQIGQFPTDSIQCPPPFADTVVVH